MQGVFESQKCKQSRGVHGRVSLRYLTVIEVGHLVKHNNKSLEDKNNLNNIILIEFFLKVKGDFPFLDIQKGGCLHLMTLLCNTSIGNEGDFLS